MPLTDSCFTLNLLFLYFDLFGDKDSFIQFIFELILLNTHNFIWLVSLQLSLCEFPEFHLLLVLMHGLIQKQEEQGGRKVSCREGLKGKL